MLLSTWGAMSQEGVLFKEKVKPNMVYSTYSTTTSKTMIDFVGDANEISQIELQGIEPSMVLENETRINLELRTQALEEQGAFQGVLEYKNWITRDIIQGGNFSVDNPFAGIKVYGMFKPNEDVVWEHFTGEAITEELQDALLTHLEIFKTSVEFPTHPLKIGDAFEMQAPLELPVMGYGILNLDINTNVSLEKLDTKKAYFNMQVSVAIADNQELHQLKAMGEGEGRLEYDLEENYITLFDLVMPVKMTVDILENVTVVVQSENRTEQRVVIRERQGEAEANPLDLVK